MTAQPPGRKPARPNFSSGPCAKPPGWSLDRLAEAPLGRSHHSVPARAKLRQAIALTRAVLEIPATHRIAIVPGSDTGAVELALWSLLGARGIDLLTWDAFGARWVGDVVTQLRLSPMSRVLRAPFGEIIDLHTVDCAHDVVFVWNATSSGVRVPNADWIAADRQGLTICDATSAVFAQRLDWAKLDVVTFSWQKALGSEAAHGMLVLGPRAVARLESYVPPWPLPRLFRLADDGKLIDAIFEGATLNTPSLLCVEDFLAALQWALGQGGLTALMARADANAGALAHWVEKTSWIDYLAKDEALRSNTSVCLEITDPAIAALTPQGRAAFIAALVGLLERQGVAYDIAAHREAPPGLRIWCGPTIETADVEALTPWLDYAFATTQREWA